MSGLFITFEGPEGSGKTTQLKILEQRVRAGGRNCVATKEPGGTTLGDRIRAILLDPNEEGMDPVAELFLYGASRRQHVVEVIRPALENDSVVLCDRFTDATLAYQGYGRLLNLQMLERVNDWATDGTYPDLVLIFDIPEQVGLERARARNVSKQLENEGRLEGEDLRFHRRVREGYLAIAKQDAQRYVVVDASGTEDDVHQRVVEALAARVPKLKIGGNPR